MATWDAKTSTGDPYGRPAETGNYIDVWRALVDIPCKDCGATGKQLNVVRREATITCKSGHVLMQERL